MAQKFGEAEDNLDRWRGCRCEPPGSSWGYIGRLHPLVSLQYELNMMPLRWEGMRRCIEFWVMVLRLNEERLLHEGSDVGSLGKKV